MTFSLNISPDKLDSARSRLRTQGISVPEADSGTLEARGVLLEYNYSEGILTVKIVRKPALVQESYVEKAVREWFK